MKEAVVGRIDHGLNAIIKFKHCYAEVQNELLVLSHAMSYTTKFNKVPDWPVIPESFNQAFEGIWGSMERLDQIVNDLYEMKYEEPYSAYERRISESGVFVFSD